MKNIMLFLLVAVFGHSSMAVDVIGIKHAIIVKTHSTQQELISFKHCLIDKEKKVLHETCEVIGSNEYYSLQELKDFQFNAYGKTIASGVAGTVIVGGGIFILGTIGGGIAVALGGAKLLGITVGAIAWPAMLSPMLKNKSKNGINLVYSYKQAKVLGGDIVNDVDFEAGDERVKELVA